ncbi:MAG: ABC transporter permease [Sterolibacteriaceae bacterium]|nr:ABC transporter permease [Candidatus Methylophosphatis haderslevensis]
MKPEHYRLPELSLRFVAVWRRNFLVWRKLAIPSVLGNLADPLLYVIGLGFGLGMLVKEVQGVSYITFLATGIVCQSTMNSATFEALYSAYSRLATQRTWEAILNAPMSLDDIVLAELVWAASKSVMSGVAILLVICLFGLTDAWSSLWVLPIIFLIGLAFAALGLCVTALAPSYDFFMYYFTLFITPMMLASGVFFPIEQLPPAVQSVAHFLPLSHAVELVRPLLLGRTPDDILLHCAVLLGVALVGYHVALVLCRRRMIK